MFLLRTQWSWVADVSRDNLSMGLNEMSLLNMHHCPPTFLEAGERRSGFRRMRLQGGFHPGIFLLFLRHQALADEDLKLLVDAQAKHFFSSTDRIPHAELGKDALKKIVEIVGRFFEQRRHEVFGNNVALAAKMSVSFIHV